MLIKTGRPQIYPLTYLGGVGGAFGKYANTEIKDATPNPVLSMLVMKRSNQREYTVASACR